MRGALAGKHLGGRVSVLIRAVEGSIARRDWVIVCFVDALEEPRSPSGPPEPPSDTRNLYVDLQLARDALSLARQERHSAEEELRSSNEELRAVNEELATSREELQSLNEETITVNGELNARIEQFSGMQNDMKNLLDSTSTATLFLDNQLAIRRYTPTAVKVYRLIASDVGRPLGDITSNIEGEHLLAELQGVLDSLIPREREVRTLDGAWYLARMQPYRTLDNVIAGVVLTFTDVSDFKLARSRLGAVEQARSLLAEGIINTVSEPLIVLDSGLQVVSANASFYREFQLTAEESVGRKIFDLGQGQWNIPALYPLLEDILPREQVLEGYLVDYEPAPLVRRQMRLNARRIVTAAGDTELILLAITGTLPMNPT
jgi:two-component system CheB/CheR fusion protein